MACDRKIGPFDCCSVVQGDCLELMKQLPDGCVDAVITDPPYGIADTPNTLIDRVDGRRGPRGGHVNTWHPPSEWDKKLDPSWLFQALRMGPVALFGQWRKRHNFEAIAGCEPRAEIVWAKDMHCGAPCPVAPRDERIWVFSPAAVKTSRFETSVWDEPVIPTWEHKLHKNEKPLALMVRLVSWLDYAAILDPFCGSGTTLVAAKKLGRHFLGFEISPEYCEIARDRLARIDAQPNLFEPKPEQLQLGGE